VLWLYLTRADASKVWGVTIGGTVLQNQLLKRLPSALLAQIPGAMAIAYELIPVIKTFEEPLRTEVRVAFASSLQVVWEVFTGIAALGLVISLLMKRLPLAGTSSGESRRSSEDDDQLAIK
jgi:hypothetical protein